SRSVSSPISAADEWRLAMDEGWDVLTVEGWDASVELIRQNVGPKFTWAVTRAAIARTHARGGHVEAALRQLSSVLAAIERAPGWADGYTRMICDAAETLWLTARTDWIDDIERNLREKVIAPDFRFPMMDGRLALARLRALQRRYEEALEWFAKARTVLDEQGARPLRAIVDYDEALMYARRDGPGDRERALPLLDSALAQFRALGMPGWIRRAEALLQNFARG